MHTSIPKILFILLISLSVLPSCQDKGSENGEETVAPPSNAENEKALVEALEKHLNAVSNKDLKTLKSTMSPKGKMQLILPGSEIRNSVDGFMQYHEEWFQDTTTTWTFETKILNTEAGERIGLAVVEIIYREPKRNGEPYFNRMIVSYGLEKLDGQWYPIKDHATSAEKSTDIKE